MARRLPWILALSALVSACKEDPTTHGPCIDGTAQECSCDENTTPGVQLCVGGAFAACTCPEQVEDAGGEADAMATDTVDAGEDAGESDEDAGPSRPVGDIQCGEQSSQATVDEERPVDVIFIIDNSGSMSDESAAVERNINENFARIIGDSGADYRVIMITNHGPGSTQICVDPPLSPKPCSDTTDYQGTTAGAPANGERFFHYDLDVQSWDSVCLMLDTFQYAEGANPRPSEGHAEAPTGWHAWLRPTSLKVFVEITDDGLYCSRSSAGGSFYGQVTDIPGAIAVSRSIHDAILALSADQFGTKKAPRFIWHSLVGVKENDPIDLPYTHFDPLQVGGSCSGAYDIGAPYQMLSISTGGLRYPVCAADAGHGYDSVFRAIAHEVVRGSRVECAFGVPKPPPGKFVDLNTVRVDYTANAGGGAESFTRKKLEECGPSSFYFEDGQIKLCSSACDRVRTNDQAKLDVVYSCGKEKDSSFGELE